MHVASGNLMDFVSTISTFVAAPGIAWSLAAVAVTGLASAAALWTASSIRKRTAPAKVRKTSGNRG